MYLKEKSMKKILISIFLISFIFNFSNAEEVKKNKTDEELLKEFQNLDKKSKDLDKQKKELEKTQKTVDELKKTKKTIDEINNKLGIDKK